MKARITITLKPGVLDPQGKAIAGALHSLGFGSVGNVRQGKYIEVEVGESDPHSPAPRSSACASSSSPTPSSRTTPMSSRRLSLSQYLFVIEAIVMRVRARTLNLVPDDGLRRDAGREWSSMKASVIVFPGSNCDRDAAVALEAATGQAPAMVWHGDSEIPATDLIVLPGGFSYGDYLRSGAMAAHSPVMREVVSARTSRHARARHLQRLPGADRGCTAARRADAQCDAQIHLQGRALRSSGTTRPTPAAIARGEVVRFPIAHKDGSYFADERRSSGSKAKAASPSAIATRTAITADANPNGSRNNIAGIYNETGTVLGLMPHPERLADPALGGTDGAKMFLALVETLPLNVAARAARAADGITPELVAEHGLSPDEYKLLLEGARPRADADRARHLLGDVVRALLLQILASVWLKKLPT